MIQGGGFIATGKQKITGDPIVLESDKGLSNKRGTIAMARTNDPNSATSQFFINLVDNGFLDARARRLGLMILVILQVAFPEAQHRIAHNIFLIDEVFEET
jgi:cyclophilin family peptidyl-prolyl cis-trans isomerase